MVATSQARPQAKFFIKFRPYTILPAQVSSRTLHHPANPLYSIILQSHSFPTIILMLLIPSAPIDLSTTLHLDSGTISLLNIRKRSIPSPVLPATPHHHLPQVPLSIFRQAFHSKLKCRIFKNFYPDSSDPTLSNLSGLKRS